MGRVRPKIDPRIAKKITEEGLNPRHLESTRKFGFVPLPARLEFAAMKKIQEFADARFRSDAKELTKILYRHKLPDDEMTLKKKKADIMLELELRGKLKNAPSYDPEDDRLVEQIVIDNAKLQQIIEGKLNPKRRDWHYYHYDEYSSVMYMAVRLAPNYAGIKTVMKEIKSALPDFKPVTVLDFGSGMGVTSWAIHSTWPKTAQEILNVDLSKDQQDLNEFLQRGGKERGVSLPGVFHRQYLPMSQNNKYDMVVAAYSLLDLPNVESRISTIENLWDKTSDLLVLIERGTRGGFTVIQEARHLILEMTGHEVTKRFKFAPELSPQLELVQPDSRCLSPCPHELACPRMTMSNKKNQDVCRFPVSYEPLEIGHRHPHPMMREEFSYVVLRKGGAVARQLGLSESVEQSQTGDLYTRWPRVIEPRHKSNKQVTHRLCCSNGNLCSITVTKAKYGVATWKAAKVASWGDILPIEIDDTAAPLPALPLPKEEERRGQVDEEEEEHEEDNNETNEKT